MTSHSVYQTHQVLRIFRGDPCARIELRYGERTEEKKRKTQDIFRRFVCLTNSPGHDHSKFVLGL
jgi:hypothetical protein